MKQVLIDYARKTPKVEYVGVEDTVLSDQKPRELLKLERALAELAEFDQRKAAVVECRFFIGLTIPEIAEVIGVGKSTVERDWEFSRDWLHHQLTKKRNDN